MSWGREPDNDVNTCVIRLVHRYSSVNFKRFAEIGIHPAQLAVLKILEENEGINLRELSVLLHVKPPTASVTVKRMEKNGLICKKTDSDDQRISRLCLSEKGRSMSSEVDELLQENERLMTAGFSEEELMQLCGYLQRMTGNLERASAEKQAGSACGGELREGGRDCGTEPGICAGGRDIRPEKCGAEPGIYAGGCDIRPEK